MEIPSKKSGSFALPLCGVPFRKLLRLVLLFVNHNGPAERTGGDARGQDNQALYGEAPGRASESPGAARNGVRFYNKGEIGARYRVTLSDILRRDSVAVASGIRFDFRAAVLLLIQEEKPSKVAKKFSSLRV